MPNCKFYGHSGIMGELFPTGGNQCGMITDSHAPCQMEMEGMEPDWGSCPLNIERAILPMPRFRHPFLYILGGKDGHTPIAAENPMEWATWFTASVERRIVRQEPVMEFWVSTVFLGANLSGDIPPTLFETATFGPEGLIGKTQATTWAGAVFQHEAMVKRIKKTFNG